MAIAWIFDAFSDRELNQWLDSADAETADDRRLRCAACARPVTSREWQRTAHGAHEHTFVNPHGIPFRIGCFDAAPGCVPMGEATEEWTWFPGYAWRPALCAHCRTHLGWRYESSAGDGFYGLILARLTSPS